MFATAFPVGLSASSFRLDGGRAGILQTVQLMRALVDQYKINPEIRALALNIVEFLPPKDYLAEIGTVFAFVRDEIRYVQDIADVETVATPDKTLEMGQGDCDDKSVLLACLLEAIGFKTCFKLAGYHGSAYEHVYVYLPEWELHLDATEPQPMGYEPPGATATLYVQ